MRTALVTYPDPEKFAKALDEATFTDGGERAHDPPDEIHFSTTGNENWIQYSALLVWQ